MGTEQPVDVELICTEMPGARFEEYADLRLGIQRGREVVDDVPGDAAEPTFRFSLRLKENTKTGHPNFLGPYTHGSPQDRFVVLSWGERRDGGWHVVRRAKIGLGDITWEQINKALRTHQPLRAVIHMTDDRGGPLCATVKTDKIRWKA